MAGGPFAEHVHCMQCADRGVVTRAERVHEGVETDLYTCPKGHEFGLYWHRGAPESPQWPPPADEVAVIEAQGRPEATDRPPHA